MRYAPCSSSGRRVCLELDSAYRDGAGPQPRACARRAQRIVRCTALLARCCAAHQQIRSVSHRTNFTRKSYTGSCVKSTDIRSTICRKGQYYATASRNERHHTRSRPKRRTAGIRRDELAGGRATDRLIPHDSHRHRRKSGAGRLRNHCGPALRRRLQRPAEPQRRRARSGICLEAVRLRWRAELPCPLALLQL